MISNSQTMIHIIFILFYSSLSCCSYIRGQVRLRAPVEYRFPKSASHWDLRVLPYLQCRSREADVPWRTPAQLLTLHFSELLLTNWRACSSKRSHVREVITTLPKSWRSDTATLVWVLRRNIMSVLGHRCAPIVLTEKNTKVPSFGSDRVCRCQQVKNTLAGQLPKLTQRIIQTF